MRHILQCTKEEVIEYMNKLNEDGYNVNYEQTLNWLIDGVMDTNDVPIIEVDGEVVGEDREVWEV